MVLGPSGSGKTVLLASLYKQLSTPGDDIGFFLEVEDDQRLKLNEIYAQVAANDQEWPASNLYGDVSEWLFTCKVDGSDITRSIFQFTYMDYAGGRLTQAGIEASSAYTNAIERADVFLGLLDGHKILTLMQAGERTRSLNNFIYKDIPAIIQVMQKRAKPAHFVVTKWDLLEKTPYTLSAIRYRLMEEVIEFQNFVNSRRTRYPSVRLIPVSSVGFGFAELRPSDPENLMHKRAGVPIKPEQLEMLPACAFVDDFKVILQSLPAPSVKKRFSFRLFVALPVVGGLLEALQQGKVAIEKVTDLRSALAGAGIVISIGVLKQIQRLLRREARPAAQTPARKRSRSAKRQRKQAGVPAVEQAEIIDERTATDYLVKRFVALVDRLLTLFPASNLSSRE